MNVLLSTVISQRCYLMCSELTRNWLTKRQAWPSPLGGHAYAPACGYSGRGCPISVAIVHHTHRYYGLIFIDILFVWVNNLSVSQFKYVLPQYKYEVLQISIHREVINIHVLSGNKSVARELASSSSTSSALAIYTPNVTVYRAGSDLRASSTAMSSAF